MEDTNPMQAPKRPSGGIDARSLFRPSAERIKRTLKLQKSLVTAIFIPVMILSVCLIFGRLKLVQERTITAIESAAFAAAVLITVACVILTFRRTGSTCPVCKRHLGLTIPVCCPECGARLIDGEQ